MVSPGLLVRKSLAVVDVGISFDQAFVDRLKQRFGVDIAVHTPDGETFKRLASTFGEGSAASDAERFPDSRSDNVSCPLSLPAGARGRDDTDGHLIDRALAHLRALLEETW